jgi:hypothetical protein
MAEIALEWHVGAKAGVCGGWGGERRGRRGRGKEEKGEGKREERR